MNYFDQLLTIEKESAKLLLRGSADPVTQQILFKKSVEIVNLELSYMCNRKCDYCPVKDSDRQSTQQLMNGEIFASIINSLAAIRYENRISLNLYNEPLLDTSLEEKIKKIRCDLPYSHISFNSNGDNLSRERLLSLGQAGLNYICVTFHPPPDVLETKKSLKKRLEGFLQRNEVRRDALLLAEEDRVEFIKDGVRVLCRWPNWRADGTSRAGVLKHHQSMSAVRVQPCLKPFRELTVFYDGSVQPCCEAFHDREINLCEIGRVGPSVSIFDVYSSESMAAFRRSVFSFGEKTGICEHCVSADYSDQASDQAERVEILGSVMKQ